MADRDDEVLADEDQHVAGLDHLARLGELGVLDVPGGPHGQQRHVAVPLDLGPLRRLDPVLDGQFVQAERLADVGQLIGARLAAARARGSRCGAGGRPRAPRRSATRPAGARRRRRARSRRSRCRGRAGRRRPDLDAVALPSIWLIARTGRASAREKDRCSSAMSTPPAGDRTARQVAPGGLDRRWGVGRGRPTRCRWGAGVMSFGSVALQEIAPRWILIHRTVAGIAPHDHGSISFGPVRPQWPPPIAAPLLRPDPR